MEKKEILIGDRLRVEVKETEYMIVCEVFDRGFRASPKRYSFFDCGQTAEECAKKAAKQYSKDRKKELALPPIKL